MFAEQSFMQNLAHAVEERSCNLIVKNLFVSSTQFTILVNPLQFEVWAKDSKGYLDI